jgi:cellulose synthase/poly-beta-1,6-N-acetylglucosamine synthase-like glycosyltransferase
MSCDVLHVVFWVCLVLAGYSYVFYPLLILLLPRRTYVLGRNFPAIKKVSIVIAARDEQLKIEDKVRNTMALQHPGIDLEIIVASDASEDRTDEIARSFAADGVLLARAPQRLGKENAQRLAIAASSGDLIVFTDAGTSIPPNSIVQLLMVFSDPTVGAVSSVDRIVSEDGSVQGEGLYVRYEMWLRDLEGRFNTLVGLSGSFFAARRNVCADWDSQVPSDFGTALNCARLGLRAVSDRSVIGYYKNLADPTREYSRKRRTVLRGMAGLLRRKDVLNPLQYGWFAFQVLSHKVLRWAVPWFLVVAYGVSLVIASGSVVYTLAAVGLTVLFLSPVAVRIVPSLARISLLRFAAFFVEANLAIMDATLRLMRGQTMLTWDPSKR